MRKLLTATAAAALLFGASAGFAQTATDNVELYVVSEGDTMRVMGGDATDGVVIVGERANPGVPGVCPEGSFFWSAENTLTECGVDGATYVLTEPASGAMMSSGQPFPQGAMVLTAEDDADDNNATTTTGGTTGTAGTTGTGTTGTGTTGTGTTGGTTGGTGGTTGGTGGTTGGTGGTGGSGGTGGTGTGGGSGG